MEIKQLTRLGFTEFPQIFAIPGTLITDMTLDNGEVRQHAIQEIDLATDATIQGAIYSPQQNRCTVKVTSRDGALVQDFRIKFDAGYTEFKGQKLLHVTVVDTQRTFNRKQHYLTLELSNGKRRTLRRPRQNTVISARVEDWLPDNLAPVESWKPDSLTDKGLHLYFSAAYFPEHYDDEFRRKLIAARICFVLFHGDSKYKTSLDELIAAGYLTGYPQIDIPAKVLRQYDSKINYTFMGLMQKGGQGGHTMNLQTANRIARMSGESVSVEDMLSQLDTMTSVRLGPMRVWALGIATKTIKELS